MARINKSKYAILGMLGVSPMSGYDIRQMAEKSIGYFWSESYGQIYPVLKMLREEGLAEELPPASGGGHKARRVFAITPAGRQVLREWLSEPPEITPTRSEVLLKIFFGHNVGPRTIAAHLRGFIPQLEEKLAVFQGIEVMLKGELKENPHAPYYLITLRQGLHGHRANLAWLRESIQSLEALPENPSGGAPGGL